MKQTLRLFITADWPSQDAGCEWVLVDGAGSQLQRGCSEPRHWPAAAECEVVLSAEQCLLLRASLPKVAKSRLQDVISYALEDHLIGDAEADHFVAGDTDADGSTPVWVVSRARLKALLAALNSVGRVPRRVCSEIQLAPRRAGCWSVCLREPAEGRNGAVAFGFVRTGVEEGFAFSLDEGTAIEVPPLELGLALQSAQGADKAPESIAVYLPPGIPTGIPDKIVSAWQAELGVPITHAGDYIWYENFGAAGAARNLLINEFAPPRRPQDGLGSFRPALYLAGTAALVFSVFTLGEWFWLSRQSGQLQQQMTATFRSAFPQPQALVNPPLQMRRLYDRMRREQGQLGSADFLPLLAAAGESSAGQGRLSRLGYEDGRLEITLALPQAADAARIGEIMKSRGLAVTLQGTRPARNAQGVEATFSLRGAQ